MQIAILAGGLGTRLRPITQTVPKSLVPVAGKPFQEHQIALLRDAGITDIVLLVAHMGEMIVDYFGDGSAFGVKITYSNEGPNLLDTAGAIRHAAPLLQDRFFVTFGDSYLLLPYGRIWRDYVDAARKALMVVYRNDNRFDSSDIFVADGLVKAYRKSPPLPDAFYINHGLMIMRRQDIMDIREGERMSLQQFLQPLIAENQLAAWETTQRFYEIGSLAGLKELESVVGRA